jgi:hypothetical protein
VQRWFSWFFGCAAACGSAEDVPASGGAAGAGPRSALHVGTGEYSAVQPWHAVLRFDAPETIDSSSTGAVAANATIPIAESGDASGVRLSFAHGLYLDEAKDELYLSTLFTSADNQPCMPCDPKQQRGSVAVISGISRADGAQVVSRHVFGGGAPEGDLTRIFQPHGVWVDTTRDLLYVANTFSPSDRVLVFDAASSVTGNVAPSRVLRSPAIGAAVFAYVEPGEDRLFLACMAGGPAAHGAALALYNHASTADGDRPPDLRITGPSTRLEHGNNRTTHNVWFSPERRLLFAAHHTNEVLIFDLSAVDLDAPVSPELDLEPRVIDVSSSDADVDRYSVYGLFFVERDDELYVSVGYADGGPRPGTPPNGVRVFGGASSASVSGRAAASRVIEWQSGGQYFPPQPLWVRLAQPGGS